MRKFFMGSIALMLTLLLAISCRDQTNDLAVQKDADQETATSLTGVTVMNGRLKFASKAVYEQVLQQVKSLPYSELAKWEKQNLPNFTSMRTAYDNLTEADKQKIAEQNSNKGYEGFLTLIGSGEEREAVMNVDAGFLGTLVSKDGLIQIGDEIVSMGYQETKVLKNVSEAELKEIVSSGWKNAGNNKIRTYSVKRSTYSLESARVKDRQITCEDPYKSDRRFRAEIWETSQPPFYSGVGARAKHQNRFLRVWWADNAPEIRLQVNGSFAQQGLSTIDVNYDSGIKTDQNIIEWVFEECVALGCTFSYAPTSTATVSGKGDDGDQHGCTAQY